MKNKIIKLGIIGIVLGLMSPTLLALKERHLVIINSAEAENDVSDHFNTDPHNGHYKPSNLTEKGRTQSKQIAELLLNYGFDNRNIVAVYVSPLPRAAQTADVLASIGVFSKDKIHKENRLSEAKAGERENLSKSQFSKDSWFVTSQEAKSFGGESNEKVKERMLSLYDETFKKYPKGGHVIFITHAVPAIELIDSLTKNRVKLQTAQVYLVPVITR